MPVKVAEEWLNSCSGCEIAILNLGETLLEVLPHLEFVHMPVLMDHKYFGQTGEGDIHHLDIPKATVGIITGGIRNQEHLEVAEAMRKSCDVIIALGTCATHGGIPALINQWSNEELFRALLPDLGDHRRPRHAQRSGAAGLPGPLLRPG